MAGKTTSLLMLLVLSFASTLLIGHSTSQTDRKAYIVYMSNQKDEVSTSSLYTSMLQDVIGRIPTTTILKTGDCKDPFVPYIAEFSSRDPNPATHNILKLSP
ncbi:hypothetical protein ACB092_06G202900 [Castanea dentata]